MGEVMNILESDISGLAIVETAINRDIRGSFARLYCDNELSIVLNRRNIVQINHSVTESVGAVRGFHYQRVPNAEMKFIRCIKGRVWDVAIDLRRNSPTFMSWRAYELSAKNALMAVIPEGFAHGFQVMESGSELIYLHTAHYSPASEGGVRFDDPRIGVDWPMPIGDVSARDLALPILSVEFDGLEI
jgi:dTDP-4-dehydrorhamnose 3,5-epimerase